MPQPALRGEPTQPKIKMANGTPGGEVTLKIVMDALQNFQRAQQDQNDSLHWSLEALTAEVQALSGALAALVPMNGPRAIATIEPAMAPMIATVDLDINQKCAPAEDIVDPADHQPESELDARMDLPEQLTKKFDLGNDYEETLPEHFVQKFAYKLVYHPWFERVIGTVILVNMMCIGTDIELDIRGESSFFLTLADHIFLLIYVFELTARFTAEGLRCFRSPWVVFDLFLVFLGVSISWIFLPLSDLMGRGAHASSLGSVKRVLLLRFARIVRLIRALRFLKLVKSLWRLTAGMINAWNTIFSMAVMLILAIYVFSCLGAELITKDEDLRSRTHVVDEYFGSIPMIMLTLLQFVNVDSVASIYRPLIVERPILGVYFILIILVLSITLMNLVTALLVEAGIESGMHEKEMIQMQTKDKVRNLAPDIREAFRRMDTDGSGCVTQNEVLNIANGLPEPVLKILKPGCMVELFESLDQDGSGEVGELEFIEGVLEAALSELPFEVQQQLKILRVVLRKLKNMEEMFKHQPTWCTQTKLAAPTPVSLPLSHL